MTTYLFRLPLLCAVLLFSISVVAQKTNFGFYVGPTLSNIKHELKAASDVSINPFDFKFGFTAGGFLTQTFAENVGIRTELNFERKGGRSAMLLSDGHGNPLPGKHIDENFDYLQVPILFQLSAGKDFKMMIHVGYGFSYLLHRTDKFPDQITVITNDEVDPPQGYILLMPEDYKKFDHSLVAGIAASPMLLNGMRLQIGLRAYNGKLNLSQGESAFDVHNLSVALTAGIEF